ncbi:MAG: tripartite tricarboxylate transporter TctB family protein [Syntrophaceae bacterium]|nr:tripartite tricarboxylate transporter TctB family protein [Syntrophaceae bacterium]
METSKNGEMTGVKKWETAAAVCWIILGVVIVLWSASFPFGRAERPGPAIFPMGSGLILILLGTILFFQIRKRGDGASGETLAALIPSGEAFKRVAFSLGGMLLSAILLDHLGFIMAFFCLILFLLRGVQPQKWKKDTFYAAVFTLAAYVLFQVVLKTTLPKGFLGF